MTSIEYDIYEIGQRCDHQRIPNRLLMKDKTDHAHLGEHSGEYLAAQFESMFSRTDNLRRVADWMLRTADSTNPCVVVCKNLAGHQSEVLTRDITTIGSVCPTETLLGYRAPSEVEGIVVMANTIVYSGGRAVFSPMDDTGSLHMSGLSAIGLEKTGWLDMRTDGRISIEDISSLEGNADLTHGMLSLAFGLPTGPPRVPEVLWTLKLWQALVVQEALEADRWGMSWSEVLAMHPHSFAFPEMLKKPLAGTTPQEAAGVMLHIAEQHMNWQEILETHKEGGIKIGSGTGLLYASRELLGWMDAGYYARHMLHNTSRLFGGKHNWDSVLSSQLTADAFAKLLETHDRIMGHTNYAPLPAPFVRHFR